MPSDNSNNQGPITNAFSSLFGFGNSNNNSSGGFNQILAGAGQSAVQMANSNNFSLAPTGSSSLDQIYGFGQQAPNQSRMSSDQFGYLRDQDESSKGLFSSLMNEDGSLNFKAIGQGVGAFTDIMGAYGGMKQLSLANRVADHQIGLDKKNFNNQTALAQSRLDLQANLRATERPDLYRDQMTTQLASYA